MVLCIFAASHIGIKEHIPAYLDPNLTMQDLITGVSFASAGTGYDPGTAERNVRKLMANKLSSIKFLNISL